MSTLGSAFLGATLCSLRPESLWALRLGLAGKVMKWYARIAIATNDHPLGMPGQLQWCRARAGVAASHLGAWLQPASQAMQEPTLPSVASPSRGAVDAVT